MLQVCGCVHMCVLCTRGLCECTHIYLSVSVCVCVCIVRLISASHMSFQLKSPTDAISSPLTLPQWYNVVTKALVFVCVYVCVGVCVCVYVSELCRQIHTESYTHTQKHVAQSHIHTYIHTYVSSSIDRFNKGNIIKDLTAM